MSRPVEAEVVEAEVAVGAEEVGAAGAEGVLASVAVPR